MIMDDDKKILTPEEGADRIAKRWKNAKNRNSRMKCDEETGVSYCCENCDSNNFCVSREFDRYERTYKFLICHCGECDNSARQEILIKYECVWRGILNSFHRIEWEEKTQQEIESEEIDMEVNCQQCSEEYEEWEIEDTQDDGEDEESEYWEVYCDDCGHEVEFGWSRPNVGGLIYPVESPDFNPWRYFPEKRFVENWKKRGWTRIAWKG